MVETLRQAIEHWLRKYGPEPGPPPGSIVDALLALHREELPDVAEEVLSQRAEEIVVAYGAGWRRDALGEEGWEGRWPGALVRHFVTSHEAGYLVLVGGMGQGKSTWMTELIHAERARSEEPIYHCIDCHPSAPGEPRGLAACLYDRLRRKYVFPEPHEWEHFSIEVKLERLLKRLSATELRDGQNAV